MGTENTQIPDFRRMFQLAEQYTVASEILQEGMPGNEFGEMSPFLLVNSFAVELYLKCMYVLDTNQTPRKGHDWVKLFGALKPHTREAIREDFQRIVDENPVLRNLDFVNPSMLDYTDFNKSLRAARNTFDKHRYIYERVPRENWSYGRLVHQCIRNVTRMDLRLADLVIGKSDSEHKPQE